jgi:hypothetical protein
MMSENSKGTPKPTLDERRNETDRIYAEIMEAEREARLEKNIRLRKMRVVKDELGDIAESKLNRRSDPQR